MPEQKKPFVQVGRTTRALPTSTPADRARAATRSRVDAAEQARDQARAVASREAAAQDQAHASACRDLVMLRAGLRGYPPAATQDAAARVERERAAWIAAGKEARSFDAYAVLNSIEVGMGLRVAVRTGSPLAASPELVALSKEQATATDAKQAAAIAKRRATIAERRSDEEARDAAAYRARLNALGLIDPASGSYPGNMR